MSTKRNDALPSITLADVYFIAFRHKWKILICSFLGLLGAVGVYLITDKIYISEAKVLIKFVAEHAAGNPAAQDVRSPDPSGQSMINSEIQIITSRDLAEQVVDLIGSEKILRAKGNEVTNRVLATQHIMKNTRYDVPGGGSVIALYYSHPDPAVAQAVLKLLVEKYQEKHLEIHRAPGSYEFLSSQTEQFRNRLMQTEADLRKLRTNAGIVSFDAAKAGLASQMAQLRTDIMRDEGKLEAARSLLPPQPNGQTNTNSAAVAPPASKDLRYYRIVCEQLDGLRVKEIEALGRYTESNPAVISIRSQMTDLEKRKKEMEEADPRLTMTAPSAAPGSSSAMDPAVVFALEAEIKILKSQWERLRGEAASLDGMEESIKDLERRRMVDEQNYQFFAASLERAKIDQALEASKLANISIVQAASIPALYPLHRSKPAALFLMSGVATGILLALLFEFIIDPTIKRPVDFARQSLMPVMLAIPFLGPRKPRRKRLPFSRKAEPQPILTLASLPDVADHAHPMRPYFDAVRDRLLVQFEGIARKPKLVGITSCSNGAGSSLLAAGLAASLSETGDGNVLLVDLNLERGAAHQFFNGKPVCALHDAVEEDKRDHGMAQDKLYLASVNQPNGSTMPPSRKIAELMPRLRASDYDYIIFDMPPVSQTSITFRIAGLMDDMLMVVEAGRTNREVLKQAHALLQQSKAKVEAVLNRYDSPVPSALRHELGGPEVR